MCQWFTCLVVLCLVFSGAPSFKSVFVIIFLLLCVLSGVENLIYA